MFGWKTVNPNEIEIWKDILREEGVLEEELDKELEKLMSNATVSSNVRAVLITPVVDKALRDVIGSVDVREYSGELEIVKEVLWPR